MKKASEATGHATCGTRIFSWLPKVMAALLMVIQLASCSKQTDTTKQPAKPPEPKNQTYRMIGGQSVISLVSSDELEIRQGGENLVCKYTKQDGRLRVVVNALGTTTAKYFNITPEGLVDEAGDTYYEPATYEKITAQIELNRQLWAAVEKDDETEIAAVLVRGASVHTRAGNRTALDMAIEKGNTNAIKTLLSHGANPNDTDANDEPLIFAAIRKGNATAVSLLITHNADIETRTASGLSPLMIASSFTGGWNGRRTPEHDDIVKMLCDAGAQIDAIDESGTSALLHSIINNCLGATRLLAAAGANTRIKSHDGRDAHSYSENSPAVLVAIRSNEERESIRLASARYRDSLIGEWTMDGGLFTFLTNTEWTYNNGYNRQWSLDEDILYLGDQFRTFQIVSMSSTSMTLRMFADREVITKLAIKR